jgi:hypothetical protein
MPQYTFVLTGEGKNGDVRWAYLPTDDAARTYAHILARHVRAESTLGPDLNLCMVVTNGHGRNVASIRVFRD